MCGIAGYIGKTIDGVLGKMSSTLHHRGPDSSGEYIVQPVHLAHTRLAIIDLPQGVQPMHTIDSMLTVIFNGEIYNHKELRLELEDAGHTFITDHSDTEVLLHGWREWGKELPTKLNGMWAFAIYDKNSNKLFLSRDRFGQKPLFYTLQDNNFVFGSELTALKKHPGISCNNDEMSLKKYFAYGFIPHPRTIYQNIFKLPGGHNLTLDISSMKFSIEKYWEYKIEPTTEIPNNPLESWGEELRELLSEAVKRRLMSDVPLGVLLSGGIDSSAIAAFASQHTDNLQTFSIGFKEKSYDESPYASRVAKMLGTKHHLSMLSVGDTKNFSQFVLENMDEPMADDSLLPTFMVCKETRKKVTVALGGDGGDELFAGYEPFRFWHLARRYNIYLPRTIHRAVESLVSLIPASQNYMALSLKLKRFFHASGRGMKFWVPALLAPLSIDEISDLTDSKNDINEIYSEAIKSWEGCASNHHVDRMTQYYVDYYLQDEILVKGDRASMLNSLEVRCPFLDINVADFARKIPAKYRIQKKITKYILKKALEDVLPHEILYRSKQGFSPPTGKWFQNNEASFFSDSPRYGKSDFLTRALNDHQANRNDQHLYLWSQLVLDTYLR